MEDDTMPKRRQQPTQEEMLEIAQAYTPHLREEMRQKSPEEMEAIKQQAVANLKAHQVRQREEEKRAVFRVCYQAVTSFRTSHREEPDDNIEALWALLERWKHTEQQLHPED
jgi:secreted Zn-dependent insulinase-like peptidase